MSRSALACPLVTVLIGHHMFQICARTIQRTRKSRMPSVVLKAAWHLQVSLDLCLELARLRVEHNRDCMFNRCKRRVWIEHTSRRLHMEWWLLEAAFFRGVFPAALSSSLNKEAFQNTKYIDYTHSLVDRASFYRLVTCVTWPLEFVYILAILQRGAK